MKALDLLEPGRLLGGVLIQELLEKQQPPITSGTRVGAYRIVRELGRGGMGRVYLAERADGEFQQQVALKFLVAVGSEFSVELFRRERQTLVGLRHPNITRMIDGGHDGSGQPWLAMELIEGSTLDQHCLHSKLPLAARLRLFLDVCQAVAFAHGRGVLHRDIKPSNVMVDADGHAKLLDFGIAQLISQAESAITAFTPGYASPEQQAGLPGTASSDVFQLGRLLAALLSNDQTEHQTQVAPSIGHQAPAPPKNLPHDLQRVILCATATEPERRYPTVLALIEDVEAFLADRPLRAYRGNHWYVFKQFLKRHTLGTMVTVLALVGAASGASYLALRIAHESDRADERARVASTALSFLEEDLLATASPANAQGRSFTVREALDQAASSVGQRFRSAPTEQQAIRITLARLYDDLGLPDLAAAEATAALKLSPESVQGAEARLVLAEIWIYQDQLDAAQTLLDSPVNSALPVPIDWPWRRQRLLALVLHRRGEYAASSEAYETLAGQLQTLAPDSGIYRTTLKELSESLMMQGKQKTALQYLDLVTAAETPELGERHPVSLATQHARATVLRHLGRFDESHTALLSITGLRREVLGNTHPETLRSLSEQATVLQELHRYEEAETLFKEVLRTRLQLIGEQHIETRNSMSNLGLLYSLWGKIDLAAPLYERVLAIELPLNDKPHPDTIALMHNIAGLYRKQRRIDAALNMHQRAIDAATASMGAHAWQTGMFHIGKAQTLQSAQRYAESALHFDAGITAMQTSLGEHHARVEKARSLKAAMTAQWKP